MKPKTCNALWQNTNVVFMVIKWKVRGKYNTKIVDSLSLINISCIYRICLFNRRVIFEKLNRVTFFLY